MKFYFSPQTHIVSLDPEQRLMDGLNVSAPTDEDPGEGRIGARRVTTI